MSTPVKESQIVKDGLRYKAKGSDSPLGEANQYAHTATMSFHLCGKYRPRVQLMARKLFGKEQKVCAPKCDK